MALFYECMPEACSKTRLTPPTLLEMAIFHKWKSLQLQVTRNAAMALTKHEDATHNVSSRSASTSSGALRTRRAGIVQNGMSRTMTKSSENN
jgi:hypothetical protein